MSEPSDNPDDPEMIEKLEAWLELGGLAKIEPKVIEWLANTIPE